MAGTDFPTRWEYRDPVAVCLCIFVLLVSMVQKKKKKRRKKWMCLPHAPPKTNKQKTWGWGYLCTVKEKCEGFPKSVRQKTDFSGALRALRCQCISESSMATHSISGMAGVRCPVTPCRRGLQWFQERVQFDESRHVVTFHGDLMEVVEHRFLIDIETNDKIK